MAKKVLVTGSSGFIGFHLAKRLLDRGDFVIGLDNQNNYYDTKLKKDRLAQLQNQGNFTFYKIDLVDKDGVRQIFSEQSPKKVVNLAAQAGVRYSLQNPSAYIDSNIIGFANILEACQHNDVIHLVFASSSSVYGANTKMPFSTHDNVDHPINLYAATKKSNELMAHAYSHLYDLPVTGLRFFTVYGPWGRPDMAIFLFTKAILSGDPIDVFNHGKMKRDFTYIDDIVEGLIRVLDRPPKPDSSWLSSHPSPSTSCAPYKIYNIGNNQPVELMYLINLLEKTIGNEAKKNMMSIQLGDVPETYADIDDLIKDIGFKPNTPIEEGLTRFVDWYKSYYSER